MQWCTGVTMFCGSQGRKVKGRTSRWKVESREELYDRKLNLVMMERAHASEESHGQFHCRQGSPIRGSFGNQQKPTMPKNGEETSYEALRSRWLFFREV